MPEVDEIFASCYDFRVIREGCHEYVNKDTFVSTYCDTPKQS